MRRCNGRREATIARRIFRIDMTEFKEIWRHETDNWELVEYEKIPNALCFNVSYKNREDVHFHFRSLGVSHEKLESADHELLNTLLNILGNVAIANDWNVSVSSFWDNLPYCIPDPEDIEPGDLENEQLREVLEQIWEFINET